MQQSGNPCIRVDIIYLDYNATTPVDPAVLERMLPFFDRHYGNASSKGHAFGWAAEEAVEIAREEIADLIRGEGGAITFTAGATESVNTAIKGVARLHAARGRHVVTTNAEHSAVTEACRELERIGFNVTFLPVDRNGRVDPEAVGDAITDQTILLTVMWANNEIGAVNSIAELGREARRREVFFLTDATQAVGKIPVNAEYVDMLACSAHKFYGPKGVGALWVRDGIKLPPLIHGGGQESGLRSGTLNVPGIVGMGAAAAEAARTLASETDRLSRLRDRLEQRISGSLPVRLNAAVGERLPQTSSITFSGVRAANLLAELRGLALSAGSACSSGTGKPSRVLKAIGLSDAEALSTIRFSLGRFTTEDDVDAAISMVEEAYAKVSTEAAAPVR